MRAFVNAHVLPMRRPHDQATALLWDGDQILQVGNDDGVRKAARDHGVEVEDLQGRVVLPGFVDAHTHFVHVGVKQTRPDLREAASLEEALETVSFWLPKHAGPVVAEGWDETGWPGGRPPTRDDLDGVSDDRPLVLRRVCGHKAVANSAAIALLKARWPDDRVDAATGALTEEPSLYLNEVLPESAAQLDAAIQAACATAHRLGVTAVGEYCQAPYLEAMRRAAAQGTLTVRAAVSIYPQQLDGAVADGFRTGRSAPGPDGPSPWLQDGGLKVFLDGSLGGRTALLREPYEDGAPGERGLANWSPEEVERLFRAAVVAGIQVHAHAIGDAAIDMGLDGFEAVLGKDGAHGSPQGAGGRAEGHRGPAKTPAGLPRHSDLRHRFEHYEIVHDEQVARTARLGIVASSQPNFVGTWSGPGGMYQRRLARRYLLNNRFRTFLRGGLRLAFGSDGMPFGPLRGLHAAIHHPRPEERLSAAEAIWHYTCEAAWSLHLGQTGHLAPGMAADLLVLDRTDLEGDPLTWTVQETISGGISRMQQDAPYPEDG